MGKPNKLTVLPECPDCGAVARDDVSYRCGSTPWSQSWTCLGDKSRRLQTRIDELETIVRASFHAWGDGGTNGLALTGLQLSRETTAAIIEICKPRVEAPV